jgi:MFS family permease
VAHIARAFRHRNYRLFFSGQLISLIGTWMQSVAESWLVYRLTGSSALLGLSAFFTQIPVFLLAPFGGTVADRGDRHRIMIVTQTISMILPLTLSALTFSGRVQVWHVFALATCLGIVNAFDLPTRQALVIRLVGREDLLNAIALNSSMFNGARAVGPAVAGILIAAFGESWCFLLNGLSYVAVIVCLLMLRLPPATRAADRGTAAIRDTLAGFQFVARTAPVRAILVLLGIASFAGQPYTVLMPIFADEILHSGPRGLGLLVAASGLGALGGALSLAARRGVYGLGRWIATSAVIFGITLALFAFSRSFWLSVLLLVPVGGSMIAQMAATNTLLQAMVPDALRGRVMAVYSMMFMGMTPFGALFAGWLAERIGAPITVALGGLVCVAAALAFAWKLPSIRAEARELVAAQGMTGGDRPAEAPLTSAPG